MFALKRVSILCACGIGLLFARSALADAVDLLAVDATDATAQSLGLSVCTVYVQFSQLDERLLGVGFSDIITNDPAGFFQHQSGGDKAPPQWLVDLSPDLAYDSFVTMGLLVVPIGQSDGTTTSPDWNSLEFNTNGHAIGDWFNIDPFSGQAEADANMQVVVGQFTVDEGSFVYGDLTAFYDDGWVWLTDCFTCYFCDTCQADLDCDDQVRVSDMDILLAAWGPNPCHPADLDGNGEVRVPDLIILNSNWGPCPCIPGDTGFVSPSAEAFDTGGDGDGFELNATDAFADDAAFASNMNGSGDRHRYYDYGFSIPLGCAVSGIEVRLDWWLDDVNGNNSLEVELSWDGGTSWTAAKIDAQETTTEHTVILGGSVDDWGRTWSPADFNDANFRVRVTSQGNGQRDWFLEWVSVKVTYPVP